MANTFEKYKQQRFLTGKINLPDAQHESIVHLVAYGESHETICKLLKVDEAFIQAVLADTFSQRRLAYKRKLREADEKRCKDPKNDAECMTFVRETLVAISKKSKLDKDRVSALKALADVARDNLTSTSPPTPQGNDPALAKLAAAFDKGSAG